MDSTHSVDCYVYAPKSIVGDSAPVSTTVGQTLLVG